MVVMGTSMAGVNTVNTFFFCSGHALNTMRVSGTQTCISVLSHPKMIHCVKVGLVSTCRTGLVQDSGSAT